MTTPDDRDERRAEVRRIIGVVRSASEPAPDDGAAGRIADGAWKRAGMTASRRAGPRRVGHATRRWAIAATVFVAVGLGALAIRPTEPVFAVEGEPVKVWEDDDWQETRSVRPGSTVFVTGGVQALRGRGAFEGEVIVPDPGATFRIVVNDSGDRQLTVQLLRGAAEVSGGSLRLSLADLEVVPGTHRSTYSVWGSLPIGDEPAGPPEAIVEAAREALARVRLRTGSATLLQRSTGERLDLAGDDMAAVLPVPSSGRTVYRMSRVRRFEPSLGMHIASGHPVLDIRRSHDGAIAVLGGPNDGITGISIDAAELPAALDQIHTAMLAFVTEIRVNGRDGNRIAAFVGTPSETRPALEDLAVATGGTVTEISISRNGDSLRIRVRADGSVELEQGGAVREFDSLDAARAADPDALEILAPHLDR